MDGPGIDLVVVGMGADPLDGDDAGARLRRERNGCDKAVSIALESEYDSSLRYDGRFRISRQNVLRLAPFSSLGLRNPRLQCSPQFSARRHGGFDSPFSDEVHGKNSFGSIRCLWWCLLPIWVCRAIRGMKSSALFAHRYSMVRFRVFQELSQNGIHHHRMSWVAGRNSPCPADTNVMIRLMSDDSAISAK